MLFSLQIELHKNIMIVLVLTKAQYSVSSVVFLDYLAWFYSNSILDSLECHCKPITPVSSVLQDTPARDHLTALCPKLQDHEMWSRPGRTPFVHRSWGRQASPTGSIVYGSGLTRGQSSSCSSHPERERASGSLFLPQCP